MVDYPLTILHNVQKSTQKREGVWRVVAWHGGGQWGFNKSNLEQGMALIWQGQMNGG